ncbi:PREDICTED: coiled-coil domain-containing protein 140 [Galeopterus variegatus]|uniref:Coiled-coil domain-containing protein 140 n=1 Tax=Galeopterus variegatus TaxID=482537 RepID=A0ABM0SG88_GALVR|nr:PREDICTED: coiled-coil domain-containing protein 140 [Galeopterus variegatus]
MRPDWGLRGLDPGRIAATDAATVIRPPAVFCQKHWRRSSPRRKIGRDEFGFGDWVRIWAPHCGPAAAGLPLGCPGARNVKYDRWRRQRCQGPGRARSGQSLGGRRPRTGGDIRKCAVPTCLSDTPARRISLKDKDRYLHDGYCINRDINKGRRIVTETFEAISRLLGPPRRLPHLPEHLLPPPGVGVGESTV